MIPNNPNTLAPICLFVYKRLDTLTETVKSLQKNALATSSDLYIFSDAARKEHDEEAVNDVRKFCKTMTGFKSVHINFSDKNLGLATSIIKGVTDVISRYNKVIVLEDDLVVSDNFLCFMNKALQFYKDHDKMFSVAGYSSPIKGKTSADVYFTKRASSWGWATWKNKWETIDWNVLDYKDFAQDTAKQKHFNKMGSDLSKSLKSQRAGEIDSWAIRWVYEQFKRDQYTVYPVLSKVLNEGFGNNATNTFIGNKGRFSTSLDTTGKTNFCFLPDPRLEPFFLNQFTDRYSIKTRILYKVKGLLNKFSNG